MPAVEAVYQGGVFKPVADVADWLAAVRDIHRQIVSTHGQLPDSTPDIAADRVRDDCYQVALKSNAGSSEPGA